MDDTRQKAAGRESDSSELHGPDEGTGTFAPRNHGVAVVEAPNPFDEDDTGDGKEEFAASQWGNPFGPADSTPINTPDVIAPRIDAILRHSPNASAPRRDAILRHGPNASADSAALPTVRPSHTSKSHFRGTRRKQRVVRTVVVKRAKDGTVVPVNPADVPTDSKRSMRVKRLVVKRKVRATESLPQHAQNNLDSDTPVFASILSGASVLNVEGGVKESDMFVGRDREVLEFSGSSALDEASDAGNSGESLASDLSSCASRNTEPLAYLSLRLAEASALNERLLGELEGLRTQRQMELAERSKLQEELAHMRYMDQQAQRENDVRSDQAGAVSSGGSVVNECGCGRKGFSRSTADIDLGLGRRFQTMAETRTTLDRACSTGDPYLIAASLRSLHQSLAPDVFATLLSTSKRKVHRQKHSGMTAYRSHAEGVYLGLLRKKSSAISTGRPMHDSDQTGLFIDNSLSSALLRMARANGRVRSEGVALLRKSASGRSFSARKARLLACHDFFQAHAKECAFELRMVSEQLALLDHQESVEREDTRAAASGSVPIFQRFPRNCMLFESIHRTLYYAVLYHCHEPSSHRTSPKAICKSLGISKRRRLWLSLCALSRLRKYKMVRNLVEGGLLNGSHSSIGFTSFVTVLASNRAPLQEVRHFLRLVPGGRERMQLAARIGLWEEAIDAWVSTKDRRLADVILVAISEYRPRESALLRQKVHSALDDPQLRWAT